jgi:hypothetical protein
MSRIAVRCELFVTFCHFSVVNFPSNPSKRRFNMSRCLSFTWTFENEFQKTPFANTFARVASACRHMVVTTLSKKFARTYRVIRRFPIGGRTYRAVSIGLDWRVALHLEFCLNQSLNYSKDHSGCDAKHEHSVGCFQGAQESPAGRDPDAAVSDRRVRG